MYNHYVYPGDEEAASLIQCDINADRYRTDESFLKVVRDKLKKSLEKFKPEMVIYNAGSDCMVGDPLGQLNLSPDGVVKRDEIVFELCLEAKIPVVMILSGGY